MTRNINASVVTELAKDDFIMVRLVRMAVMSGSPETEIYLTDADFDIVYDSNTYNSSGHLLDIGAVSESAELRVGNLNIVLSAVEQTYSNIFLANNYIDARARYWRAILDDSYAIIGEPILMFDGRVSGFKLEDSGRASKMSVECASHWSNFDTINGRKTNDTSQQAVFDGDLGLEFASHTIKHVRWGRE